MESVSRNILHTGQVYLIKLTFWNAISIVDNTCGFEAGWLVELDQQLSHHCSQVLNDVLAVLLNAYCRAVPAWMGIHAANNLNHTETSLAKRD